MKKFLMIIPLALILCFMVGCKDKEAMAELEKFKAQRKVEEQNIELIRNANETWSKKNYEKIREFFPPFLHLSIFLSFYQNINY